MIRLIFANLLRAKVIKIGLLFILTAGIISLLVGKQFIEKSERNIAETAVLQKDHINRNVEYFKTEIGYVLYYVKFSLVNNAPALSGLSIGQRDINPSIKSLTIRTLEAQKYDVDLNNPFNQLIGNIDFSFVILFLFPLLIIAFTYNIISEEKESGTWKIVMVQSKNTLKYILQLFLARILIVLGVLLLLLILGAVIIGIPLNFSFFIFVLVAVLYVLFWFSISFWVASLHKDSNFNAVILLSIWIGLLIILPAIINNYLINKYPTPEALSTTLKQRKGYHEKWDMPQKVTMDKFYAHYPEYRKYPLPSTDFSWQVYYPMQQMGDDESAADALKLREKLAERDQVSKLLAVFLPSLHTQIQLAEIAQTGLSNQLNFLDKTSQFHEKLRLYFYKKIFENFPSEKENWDKFKVETFYDSSEINPLKIVLPYLVFIMLFAGLAWRNFRVK